MRLALFSGQRGFHTRWRRPVWAGLVLLLLIAWRGIAEWRAVPRIVQAGDYLVERVIDGDTLVLAGGTRVRLIGVDTPEMSATRQPSDPLALAATGFTRGHVAGQMVRLELDRERIDRYGRTLGYVYRGDWLLNEELIRAGLSRAELHYPYSAAMKRRFRAAEETARSRRAGRWQSAPASPASRLP